jgi:hypothetical protein
MGSTAQTIGFVGLILGAGMTSVRIAANRFGWNFPAWLDYTLGVVGILLIAVCVTLLLQWFVALFGAELPANSPWPATLLYAVVSGALIFATGYLPAHVAPRTSEYKTEWQPAIAESFFLHLDSFEAGKQSTVKVKIVATKQGESTARLIAQIMKRYEWKVEVNAVDGSHVFLANNEFRGTRIRYRESRRNESEASAIFGIVSGLAEIPQTEYFPEDDQFNFAQIEIGDVPEFYSGPSTFMNESFR